MIGALPPLHHIAHLRQECHNSKIGIFELLIWKETFADALLTGIVSYRSLQNSPLESSCVVVALIENYSTSKPFKFCPERSHILSCDTLIANERYGFMAWAGTLLFYFLRPGK